MIKRDRALKPSETGHTARVAYGPGQQGSVVRFIRRSLQGYEFTMAVVRWDPQTWYESHVSLNRMERGRAYSSNEINTLADANGKPVRLPSFKLPAHPETLALMAGGKEGESAKTATELSGVKPKRKLCEPPLRAVPGTYILMVHVGIDVKTVADDLSRHHRATIRRVWPAMSSLAVACTPQQLKGLLDDERIAEIQDNCS